MPKRSATRERTISNNPSEPAVWHGTTILSVRKGNSVVVAGDGQVTLGQTVIKSNARKVRRLGDGSIIAGFAGATADAFTLLERLEAKLENIQASLCAPASSSPRIGAPTATCAASKR